MKRKIKKLSVILKQTLVEKKLKVTTCESCSGGLVAAAITEISGSSEIFEYGFVTYANRAKTEVAGVSPKTLESHGAVSEIVAAQMAEGALVRTDADLAVSITGIAGPGGGAVEKPVGMVCFGIALRRINGDCIIKTFTKIFENKGRSYIRECSCHFALKLILQAASEV